MDTTSETPAGRAELESLSAQLAIRDSITHFAVAAISGVVAVIAFGISLRLAMDVGDLAVFGPVGAIFFCCIGIALFGVLKGRRLRAQEYASFQRYQALRLAAGLD